ncbi:MAG TPA: TIM barrel protein [Puia sp.]|nr:TIM barrel protein [Puia sp.]
MNRRQFTKTAISSAAALTFYRTIALAASKYMNIPLGFQSWSVKDRLGKDFSGTLKTMADMGYKLIELCSPAGYKDSGFGFLQGMPAANIKRTIEDAGLHCPSCHFGFAELTDHIDESIAFAKAIGMSQMVCSSFGIPKTGTIPQWQAAVDKLNTAAEKIRAAGMQTGYHNHEGEFATVDGQLIYDVIMARFDSRLVKMQFQTEVINLGYKASTYFTKYPGRFISSHLSDWTADKKEVPIGKGIIDWKEFFKAAKTGGVKNFFVEMDFQNFKDSAVYVKGL